MTAHVSLTPAQAISLIEAAGIPHAQKLLADHAAADLLKSYALVTKTIAVAGAEDCVRGATVPVELWHRIVREGVVNDVWTGGTVHLAAGELIGSAPEVRITGITFSEKHVQRLIEHHCGRPVNPARRGPEAKSALEREEPSPFVPVTPKRRPDLDAIPPGALLATINQTMAALGLGRTKVNELMNSGRLERVEIDGGVRITTASIMALAGGESGSGDRPVEAVP